MCHLFAGPWLHLWNRHHRNSIDFLYWSFIFKCAMLEEIIIFFCVFFLNFSSFSSSCFTLISNQPVVFVALDVGHTVPFHLHSNWFIIKVLLHFMDMTTNCYDRNWDHFSGAESLYLCTTDIFRWSAILGHAFLSVLLLWWCCFLFYFFFYLLVGLHEDVCLTREKRTPLLLSWRIVESNLNKGFYLRKLRVCCYPG